MAVDLKQFHQVFIEESVEGLDAMESALMDLDVESIDCLLYTSDAADE